MGISMGYRASTGSIYKELGMRLFFLVPVLFASLAVAGGSEYPPVSVPMKLQQSKLFYHGQRVRLSQCSRGVSNDQNFL